MYGPPSSPPSTHTGRQNTAHTTRAHMRWGSQVAGVVRTYTQAALCLRHHVLGPSVLRRPPRCFGRCDRLRQQALTCTAARPRRRGPVRPWLKRAVCSWRCGGCGSVVRSVGAFTHVHRKRASYRCARRLGPCGRPVLALPVSAAHCRGCRLSACHTVLS